jgi:hypothetical protein
LRRWQDNAGGLFSLRAKDGSHHASDFPFIAEAANLFLTGKSVSGYVAPAKSKSFSSKYQKQITVLNVQFGKGDFGGDRRREQLPEISKTPLFMKMQDFNRQ